MQAGEFVVGIDVVFDDVEGEIVEPAEAKDRCGQEEGCDPIGMEG